MSLDLSVVEPKQSLKRLFGSLLRLESSPLEPLSTQAMPGRTKIFLRLRNPILVSARHECYAGTK